MFFGNDWRNRVPLGANHRITFDTGLFKVGADTRPLIGCEDSNLTKLGISQTK